MHRTFTDKEPRGISWCVFMAIMFSCVYPWKPQWKCSDTEGEGEGIKPAWCAISGQPTPHSTHSTCLWGFLAGKNKGNTTWCRKQMRGTFYQCSWVSSLQLIAWFLLTNSKCLRRVFFCVDVNDIRWLKLMPLLWFMWEDMTEYAQSINIVFLI